MSIEMNEGEKRASKPKLTVLQKAVKSNLSIWLSKHMRDIGTKFPFDMYTYLYPIEGNWSIPFSTFTNLMKTTKKKKKEKEKEKFPQIPIFL